MFDPSAPVAPDSPVGIPGLVAPEVDGLVLVVVLLIVTGAILNAPPKFTIPPEIVLI